MTERSVRTRLEAVDLLRGLAMVVMTLDHVRDFLSSSAQNPRDVTQPALFLTRWITHFCAPIFVFLAGSSAFLYGCRGRSTAEVSRFLATRGFWLVLLEVTIVRFGWLFALDRQLVIAQVIWAIGWSMVALSLLVFLPRWLLAAVALTMWAGHDAFDGVRAEQFGRLGWLWIVLHQGGPLPLLPPTVLFVAYPLVPWVGVMAAGYAMGPLLLRDRSARRRGLCWLGLVACAAFVLLRAVNVYGDPRPWAPQPSVLATVLAFVNCEKYPPSILFLLMTLGPAIALLPTLEDRRGRIAAALVTIGRVPLMYYVVHLIVIHALAVVIAELSFGDARWLIGGASFLGKPPGYGVGLPAIYAIWLLVVVGLLPLCRWFADVKQRRSDWWLSYL